MEKQRLEKQGIPTQMLVDDAEGVLRRHEGLFINVWLPIRELVELNSR